MLKFKIEKSEGLARAGVIKTPHGEIKTPAFVGAATRAAVKAMTVQQMRDLGAQAVLANTYHLVLVPGAELVAEAGGLAKFMGWGGPTFTDSGGFQIMSLGTTHSAHLEPFPAVRAHRMSNTARLRSSKEDSNCTQMRSACKAIITEEGVEFRSHINGDKLMMSPESSMEAQWQIGSDIHMAFDCPVGYGVEEVDFEKTKEAMERTHRWAERCLARHSEIRSFGCKRDSSPGKIPPAGDFSREFRTLTTKQSDFLSKNTDNLESFFVRPGKKTSSEKLVSSSLAHQALYGVVQGGDFPELRKKSAEFFAGRDFDGYGIGGMYEAGKGEKLLKIMNEILPSTKPRHWLGMGAEPIDLFVGAANGIDTFDCVAPTRQGRNGAVYTRDGRVNIKNARFARDFGSVDEGCDCECCKNYTRAYLHHLLRVDEMTGKTLASIHNERFVVRLCEQIREAILVGELEKFRAEFLGRYY